MRRADGFVWYSTAARFQDLWCLFCLLASGLKRHRHRSKQSMVSHYDAGYAWPSSLERPNAAKLGAANIKAGRYLLKPQERASYFVPPGHRICQLAGAGLKGKRVREHVNKDSGHSQLGDPFRTKSTGRYSNLHGPNRKPCPVPLRLMTMI